MVMKPCKLPLNDFSNYEGFYISSKVDGVRATVHRKLFFTGQNKLIRNNSVAVLPHYFELPFIPDGEIVCGSCLRETTGFLNSKSISIVENLSYYIFDIMDTTEPFYTRLSKLRQYFDAHQDSVDEYGNQIINISERNNNRLVFLNQKVITDDLTIAQTLSDERNKDYPFGEGLIVRDPQQMYRFARASSGYYKIKFTEELEATVVKIHPHSKKQGLLGALECECPEFPETFHVGTGFTEQQRSDPSFREGIKIKFRYRPLSSELNRPNLPVFMEICK